jgi:hypothetical protein
MPLPWLLGLLAACPASGQTLAGPLALPASSVPAFRAPAAPARAAAPRAATERLRVAARLAAGTPGAPLGRLRRALGRIFDGMKKAAPPVAVPAYLERPPDIPLARIEPEWVDAPARPPGGPVFREGESRELSKDFQLEFAQDIELVAVSGKVLEESAPLAGSDLAVRGGLAVSGQVARVIPLKDGVAWLDSGGDFYYFDRKKNQAYRVDSPQGKVRLCAASWNGDYAFVAVGKSFQRWDLSRGKALSLAANFVDAGKAVSLRAVKSQAVLADGAEIVCEGVRWSWIGRRVVRTEGSLVPVPSEAQDSLPDAQEGVHWRATPDGLVEDDARLGRRRLFRIPGLREAAASGPISLGGMPQSRSFALAAGNRIFTLEAEPARRRLDAEDSAARLWSQAHPMSVSGGALRIGDFSFPIGDPGLLSEIGEDEWKALNLPTNKRLVYDALKGFSMNQHVLLIGETGGGKTWLAERIARLIGSSLWMASLNEYTRPKDLVARETFGESGKGRTGLSLSTVLMWMERRGVLLLDELHKPAEGISVVNNILQNGVYRLSDGRVFRVDKKSSWVIGTMNPVKPPYNGQPPSGELSSRFGLTLEVKYLPPEEEAALLKIFFPGASSEFIDRLVAVAGELRRAYPDLLPLPVASRTLMHVVEHALRFPEDDAAEIFRTAYNPASVAADPDIARIVEEVLERHKLRLSPPKAPS